MLYVHCNVGNSLIFYFAEHFQKTPKNISKLYGFSFARHAKIDFMTLVKFSFQSLKFVTNKKADNSMCVYCFKLHIMVTGSKNIQPNIVIFLSFSMLCSAHLIFLPLPLSFQPKNRFLTKYLKILCSKVTTILLNLTECVDLYPGKKDQFSIHNLCKLLQIYGQVVFVKMKKTF